MPLKTNTIEIISQKMTEMECKFKLKDGQKYVNAHSLLIWICDKHGEFSATWNYIQQKHGCPYCNGMKVNETNSVFHNRKDLLIYFKDKEEAKYVTQSSEKEFYFICPDCGFEKFTQMKNITWQGFGCQRCSDGISKSEKMIREILKYLNIDFVQQYSQIWSLNKRYDFYIPHINTIIEVHGEQHYTKRGKFKNTVEEEQKNDLIKKDLALKNGIDNYIIIDCGVVSLNSISNNIKKELSGIINLSTVDFNEIWAKSQRSICSKVWEIWDNDIDINSEKLAEIFKVHKTTILNWLRIGADLNKCSYTIKDSRERGARSRSTKYKYPEILKYTMDGIFIAKYKNCKEASDKNNLKSKSIYRCCSGGRKSYGGFIWRYDK